MMQKSMKSLAWALVLLMLPSLALASGDSDRIADLEARVEALEARMDALLDDNRETGNGETEPLAIGAPLELEPGRSITLTSYDTGNRFKYSPAGGFSTLTLSAKTGYRLLCLFTTVNNESSQDLSTAQLLDATVCYGDDYTNKAQDSFFYRTSMGAYAGGLKSIGPNTSVEGCLLFAVPEDIDESRARISVQLVYDDTTYECVLRPGGARLEAGEPAAF
ncbi:hypothetical protein LJC74_09420 [Eubacteriales bacterium OttesenSCG-928-A19]|nr:hypothetical protein [Eubacteriales bacterium OttesenSCG-928-A19]